jgi:hypothetical protein
MNIDAIRAAYAVLAKEIPAGADQPYGSFLGHLQDFVEDHCGTQDEKGDDQ